MRRLLTGLMGLTVAVGLASSAFAGGHHHGHNNYYRGYHQGPRYVAAYPRVAVPYAYPAPCDGYSAYYPAPVYAVPAPIGIGVQTRRFGLWLGY